jgi:hypothetical protein
VIWKVFILKFECLVSFLTEEKNELESFELVEKKSIVFKLLALCGNSQFFGQDDLSHFHIEFLSFRHKIAEGFLRNSSIIEIF